LIFLVFLFTLVFHTNFNKCWIFDFYTIRLFRAHSALPCVYILYCVLNAIRYQMLSTMNMSIIVGWNIFFSRLVRYYKLKLRWLWAENGVSVDGMVRGTGVYSKRAFGGQISKIYGDFLKFSREPFTYYVTL